MRSRGQTNLSVIPKQLFLSHHKDAFLWDFVRWPSPLFSFAKRNNLDVKFSYSEKATKFEKITQFFDTTIKVSKYRRHFMVSSILPRNELKKIDLRYHSSKVEFFHSFFGRIEETINPFEINWPLVNVKNLGDFFFKFCGPLRIAEL
jgi:hypothetical protein